MAGTDRVFGGPVVPTREEWSGSIKARALKANDLTVAFRGLNGLRIAEKGMNSSEIP